MGGLLLALACGCVSQLHKSEAPNTNSQFLAAVATLNQEHHVGGSDNGWDGQWEFYKQFRNVFSHGSLSDFEHMTNHTNAVVRVMGLLCVKYIDPQELSK